MKYKALMLLGFILSHLELTAADTVTTHQYEWDEGSNTSIAIPSNLSKNFCITFEANPKNDFHIGLYSATYTRVLDESGAYIQSKEATPLASGARNTLSAIVEFCYGGWGNVQSALRIDYMNTRSARSQETMIPDFKIPEANKGVFRTYTVTVTLTQSEFKMVFAYQDPTTNTPVVIRTITQADLAPASGGVLAESTFAALQKSTFQGFTKLGFLVYDTTYTVKNWTVTQPTADPSAVKAVEETTAADKLASDAAAKTAKAPNVTTPSYAWDGSQNLAIPIPAEYKTDICLTFEANPTQDLNIGLYSTAYRRVIDANTTLQAREVTQSPVGQTQLLSAIVELCCGGWSNTQSAPLLEWHSSRTQYNQQLASIPNVKIAAEDVGVMRTYQVKAALTTTTFSMSLAKQNPQTKEFATLISINQNDLPPAQADGESMFDALKKILTTGFTHIGFVGYGPGYTVQNWVFTQSADAAAKVAADKAEADRLAAEKAAQDKATADAKAAADKAAADKLAADTKATEEKAAADAKIAAEKAAADKLAADAAAKAAADKAEADRIAGEKDAQAKADAARLAAEKAAADAKVAAEKAEATRLAAEKAAQEKVAAEKAAAGAAAKARASASAQLSLGDLKKQAAATKQYDVAKIKMQTTLTKALEGQRAALAATTSADKITAAIIKKPLQKNAVQLKATLDDYVAKISKAQNTLTLTPPPFTTPLLIARGQKNADNAVAYANTALTLVNQRIKSIESLQKKIDNAMDKK